MITPSRRVKQITKEKGAAAYIIGREIIASEPSKWWKSEYQIGDMMIRETVVAWLFFLFQFGLMSTPWKPSPLSLVTWPAPFWLASGARDAGRFEKEDCGHHSQKNDDDDDDEDAGRQTTRIYVGRIMRFRESELDFELLESRREEEDDVLSRCRHHHRRHHHRLLYSPSEIPFKRQDTHTCM